jgi:hypothetical protein
MLVECNILKQEEIKEVYQEALEILKVMSTFKYNIKPKSK